MKSVTTYFAISKLLSANTKSAIERKRKRAIGHKKYDNQ